MRTTTISSIVVTALGITLVGALWWSMPLPAAQQEVKRTPAAVAAPVVESKPVESPPVITAERPAAPRQASVPDTPFVSSKASDAKPDVAVRKRPKLSELTQLPADELMKRLREFKASDTLKDLSSDDRNALFGYAASVDPLHVYLRAVNLRDGWDALEKALSANGPVIFFGNKELPWTFSIEMKGDPQQPQVYVTKDVGMIVPLRTWIGDGGNILFEGKSADGETNFITGEIGRCDRGLVLSVRTDKHPNTMEVWQGFELADQRPKTIMYDLENLFKP